MEPVIHLSGKWFWSYNVPYCQVAFCPQVLRPRGSMAVAFENKHGGSWMQGLQTEDTDPYQKGVTDGINGWVEKHRVDPQYLRGVKVGEFTFNSFMSITQDHPPVIGGAKRAMRATA